MKPRSNYRLTGLRCVLQNVFSPSRMRTIDSKRGRAVHNAAFLYAIPSGVFFFYIVSDHKPTIKFYPTGQTGSPRFFNVRFKDKFGKFVATSVNFRRHDWVAFLGNHRGLVPGAATRKHVIFYNTSDNLFWYADKSELAGWFNKQTVK